MAKDDHAKIIAAGLLSGLAFVAAEALDKVLLKGRYSDMKLLGMAVTRKSPHYLFVGLPWHLLNSVAFAYFYSKLAGPRLPGPGWLRGLALGMIENNVLWFGLITATNKVHPAVKDGSMPPIRLWGRDWVAGIGRHVALGIVLGLLCPVEDRRA